MNGTRQSVVVGIDGSEQASVAAQWAAGEAARRKLPLRLLHAFTVPIMGVPAYGVPPDLSEGLRVAGQAALDAALREISNVHSDLEVSAELVNADPRPALVEASAEASLTVVGTRGGGRIPEVVLGSVALHVASHGRSPVAVIPPQAGEPTTGAVLLGVDGSGTSEAAIAYAFEEADRRGATYSTPSWCGTTWRCVDTAAPPRSGSSRTKKSTPCWASKSPAGGTSIPMCRCGR